jgi:hypothetical protein
MWISGRDKYENHTCIAYIVNSKQGFKEKNAILLDQDMHVCGYIYGGYPNSTMLLETYLF